VLVAFEEIDDRQGEWLALAAIRRVRSRAHPWSLARAVAVIEAV
jgi:hypothetical protein